MPGDLELHEGDLQGGTAQKGCGDGTLAQAAQIETLSLETLKIRPDVALSSLV